MSTPQLKYRSTSASPRLVIERTDSSPWTLFTACSTGRVIVTIIWSMGMTPLSMAITIRGKSVDGKTDTGMVRARKTPASAVAMITKITDLELSISQLRALGVRTSTPFLTLGSSAMRSVLGFVFFGIAFTARGVGLLYLDFGLVRQPVRALADDLLAGIEPCDDLDFLPVLNTSLDFLGLGFPLGIDHHDLRAVTIGIEQGRSRNHQSVLHCLRHDRELCCHPRAQLLAWVCRLYPDFHGRAVRVERRAYQRHRTRDCFVQSGCGDTGFVALAKQQCIALGNVRLGDDVRNIHHSQQRRGGGCHFPRIKRAIRDVPINGAPDLRITELGFSSHQFPFR